MKVRSIPSTRMSLTRDPVLNQSSNTTTPRGRNSATPVLTPRSMSRSGNTSGTTPTSRQSLGNMTPRTREAIAARSRQSVGNFTPRGGNLTPRSRASVGKPPMSPSSTPGSRHPLMNRRPSVPTLSVSTSADMKVLNGRRVHSGDQGANKSVISSVISSPSSPTISLSSQNTSNNSQQSINVSIPPTPKETPKIPKPTLPLTRQHSPSTLPIPQGPVHSQLRRTRKTVDAVRPEHVSTAINTSRTYTSELLAHRTRGFHERSESLRRISDALPYTSRQSLGGMMPPRHQSTSYRELPMSQRFSADYSVPSARRYTEGLESNSGSESSGLKVSSVFSFNRTSSRPSLSSFSSSLDSSRAAARMMRSESAMRLVDPYEVA